jgi:oligoendopeptidase F
MRIGTDRRALTDMWRSGVFVLVTACWRLQALGGQAGGTAFDPFPDGIASRYQFDLARTFYPTADEYSRAQRLLVQRFRRFEERIPAAHTSARSLLAAFVLSDSLSRELGRQYAYLSLRSAIDTKDGVAPRQLAELAAVVEPIGSEWERALEGISDTRFSRYSRSEPRLRQYAFAVKRLREEASHRLAPEAEGVLASTEPLATDWGPALFQATLAATPFGTVSAPEGQLDVRRQGNQIRNHADRGVRETGFKLGQAALGSRRDTYAFIIVRAAAARTSIARQRRWPDYQTQAYARAYLHPSEVRSLLERLISAADLNKRFERQREEAIRKAFGYDTVHVWDLTAPRPGQKAPLFTINQATELILKAAAPLGSAYLAELGALLDPANGRLDLVSRPNRVERPGFSTGTVGYPSMFFQGRFEGYLDDLIILAHEAGHGVQNMLMENQGVLPRYATGPNYFTESFAVLNELLLLEHLFRSSTDTVQRQMYLDRLVDNAAEVFRFGHESLVELQIYDSVASGRLLNAEEIEHLTQDVGARVSVWFGPGSERTLAWLQPIQFFTRPLYRVNYVFAKLLALRYLDLLHQDPSGFQRGYAGLLSNGYDAPPDELLQRFLGISARDQTSFVEGGIRVIESWLGEASVNPR